MTQDETRAPAPLAGETGETGQPPLACRLCGTLKSHASTRVLVGGNDWQCGRCGQRWDARRIATVVAYEAWDIANRAARAQGVRKEETL